MTLVDQSKAHIFLWVPGTGGSEVHPAFRKSIETVVKDNYQILCLDYPASIDFSDSVDEGVKALEGAILSVSSELVDGQSLYVAGSSQGSWVIGKTLYDNHELLDLVHKAVLFGHPGVAEDHDHALDEGDKIWEVNHPNDTVTVGWQEEEREKIVKALDKALSFNVLAWLYLLSLAVRHPILMYRIVVLMILHTKLIGSVVSPHDYSIAMPFAVYWLIH